MIKLAQPVWIAAFATLAISCVVGDAPPAEDDGIDASEDGLEDESVDLARSVLDTPEVQLDASEVQILAATASPSIVYDASERALFARINAYRAKVGRLPVRASIAETKFVHETSSQWAANNGMSNPPTDGPWLHLVAATADEAFSQLAADDATLRLISDADYKRVGVARSKGSDGLWYWSVSFGTTKDAILSLGLTSIANNGKFEAANAYVWPLAFGRVRTLGKWFFNGVEYSVDTTDVHHDGQHGLTVFDVLDQTATAAQVVRAAPGVHYRLSTFTKAEQAGGTERTPTQYVQLHFLDKSFKKIGGATVNTWDSAAWTKVTTGAVVAPAGTTFARIVIGDTNANVETGGHWYDDVRLGGVLRLIGGSRFAKTTNGNSASGR